MKKILILLLFLVTYINSQTIDTANWTITLDPLGHGYNQVVNRNTYYGQAAGTLRIPLIYTGTPDTSSTGWAFVSDQFGTVKYLTNRASKYGIAAGQIYILFGGATSSIDTSLFAFSFNQFGNPLFVNRSAYYGQSSGVLQIPFFYDVSALSLPIPNTDTVWAGGYRAITVSGTGTVGSDVACRDMFTAGIQYQIAQTGWLRAIDMCVATKTSLTGVYVKIWRRSGNTYTFIGITQNLLSGLTANTNSHVNITTPIWVQKGDLYSVLDSGGAVNHVHTTDAASVLYFQDIDRRTAFNWKTTTAVAGYNIPVRFYIDAPMFLGFGDSQISWFQTWYDWNEADIGDTAVSSYAETFSLVKKLADTLRVLTGDTIYYQNCGKGGNTTTNLLTRVTDVTSKFPRFTIGNGIINDVIANVPAATIASNWQSILENANDVGVKMFVMLDEPIPSDVATDDQMKSRDTAISLLTPIFLAKGHYLVSVQDSVGEFRVGGTAGNKWNPIPSLHFNNGTGTDGIHSNADGNTKKMQCFLASIKSVDFSPPPPLTDYPPTPNYVWDYRDLTDSIGVGDSVYIWANEKDTLKFRQFVDLVKPKMTATGLLFDTTDVLIANMPFQGYGNGMTVIIQAQFVDTNTANPQRVFSYLVSSPQTSELTLQITTNATSTYRKLGSTWHNGAAATSRTWLTNLGNHFNTNSLFIVDADSLNGEKLRVNNILGVNQGAAYTTTANTVGFILGNSENTGGMHNIIVQKVIVYFRKLTLVEKEQIYDFLN